MISEFFGPSFCEQEIARTCTAQWHALSDASRQQEQLHSKVQPLMPGVHHEITCGRY
jgi:hypothetical protein